MLVRGHVDPAAPGGSANANRIPVRIGGNGLRSTEMRSSVGGWCAALSILFFAVVPGALHFPLHENRPLEMAGFEIRNIDSIDRRAHFVDVLVEAGECVGGDRETAAQRFDHATVRVERDAYVVAIFSRDDSDSSTSVCSGVGTKPFPLRLALPGAIGQRAEIVSDAGAHRFKTILVPPVGGLAARALTPRFVYDGDSCDAVARHFQHIPRARWCPQ